MPSLSYSIIFQENKPNMAKLLWLIREFDKFRIVKKITIYVQKSNLGPEERDVSVYKITWSAYIRTPRPDVEPQTPS